MNCCGTTDLTLDNLIDTLNSAKEDRALLDDILRHYSLFSGEFEFKDAKYNDKLKKRMTPELQRNFQTDKQILQAKIEKYLDKKYRSE